MDKQMQELLEATNRFFENSINVAKRVNDRYDFFREIALVSHDDIDRYGEALIPACLVGLKLQLKHLEISELCPNGNLDSKNMRLFSLQFNRELDYIRGLILAFHGRGIFKLYEILNGKDEDIASLASMCLADHVFEHPEIISNLNSALLRAKGTGYKFALSFSLFMRGENSHFEAMTKTYELHRLSASYIPILEIVSSGNAYNGSKSWVKNYGID